MHWKYSLLDERILINPQNEIPSKRRKTNGNHPFPYVAPPNWDKLLPPYGTQFSQWTILPFPNLEGSQLPLCIAVSL